MSKGQFQSFGLGEEIVRALHSLGYTHPTEVQAKVIPIALEGRDLTVKSQTGSGKTAAFGIPICEQVEWEENKPQALILTPTRELAEQVKQDITDIGRFKRIKPTAVYGKYPFARQQAELKQKSHVVVGTPGRVLDHLERGTLDVQRLRFLVIDEADEMLNMGFITQVEAILDRLHSDRVTMLFSATWSKDVEGLCHQYMKNPIHIEIETNGSMAPQIEHSLYVVKDEDKLALLKDVLVIRNPDSCIIFCRTQEQVDILSRKLQRLGYPCDKIHGGMEQHHRFDAMKRFRRGEFRYLVATDVAARGIDIDNITLVINYDFPTKEESYVHRTGRTGRAGHVGEAVTFATDDEEELLPALEDYLGFRIERLDNPTAEDVARLGPAFEEKIMVKPTPKRDKSDELNIEIMKLYFNGGKRKKLRAVDFVGTIAKIEGVSAEDIGIIQIQDNESYVDILNGKGPIVLKAMKNTTVKGKLLKVHEAIQK